MNIKPYVNYPWLLAPCLQLSARMLDVESSLHSKSAPHALLITGTAGTARHALADYLAALMLCKQPQLDGDSLIAMPCGLCGDCKMLMAGGHPDIIRVLRDADNDAVDDDSQEIRVNQIRTLIEKMTLSAGRSGYRVALIENAQYMNTNAANALLKTLEEPGDKTLLILVSSATDKLPATIFSRCQQITVPIPTTEQALEFMQEHHRAEGDRKSTELKQTLQLALQLAMGGPLLAMTYLQQELVAEAQQLGELLQALKSRNISLTDAVTTVNDIPPQRFWHWVIFWLHRWSTGIEQATIEISLPRSQLYQQALAAYQRRGASLRQPLQVHEWLLQWQRQQTS